jgi:PAS domain S-box-containing protein
VPASNAPAPLRVLLVEDDALDAELLLRELKRAGFAPEWRRVDTEPAFLDALRGPLDIVLSDFDLPQFDGLRALELMNAHCPDVPFIIVSGTIGEETAVAAMRRGAADYLIKDRLTRLGQAVHVALEQARMRSDQRRMTEDLHRAERRYRSIFENAVEGIYQASADGRMLAANPAMARILGYASPEELLGHLVNVREQLYETPERRDEIRRLIAEQGMVTGYETRFRRKDGSIIWVRLSATAVQGDHGDVHYEGMIEDITERKHGEAQQLRSQKLEALGTLSGGIAHDFNNILLAIDGHVTLATADLPEGHPVQENLGEIGRASARAADLVRQILTFGRPHDVKRGPLHLRPVVDEAMKLVRATLPAMIDIRVVCAEGVLPIVGDATQIHQIVVNLCTNSAHALEARRGSIELRLEPVTIATQPAPLPPGLRPGRFSCLSVSDNGSGMTAETLERIFDPFYTTKAPGQGTGLGLSVVHGIVSSYGGAITVYSQPGKGSTFRLFFPALASELGDIAPIERAQAPLGHGQRVLYIDDEAALVSLALRVLTRLGYVVSGHTDVARALQEFRANPDAFDAVVTDLSMPGMSGVELVSELQATRPDVPILITSGYVPPEEQEAALRLGVRELIPKPTLIDEIGHALNRVFTKRAARARDTR